MTEATHERGWYLNVTKVAGLDFEGHIENDPPAKIRTFRFGEPIPRGIKVGNILFLVNNPKRDDPGEAPFAILRPRAYTP